MIEKDKRPLTWPSLTKDLEKAKDSWAEASQSANTHPSSSSPPSGGGKKKPEDLEKMLKELKALLDHLSQ